jgi:hypothetical protein
MASWPTPNAMEGGQTSRGGDRSKLANWSTPSARDWKDTPGIAQEAFDKSGKFRNRIDQLARQAHSTASGPAPNGSTAETKSTGQLNPAHSRWLMGLPTAWESCADMVTRSSRRKPKPS